MSARDVSPISALVVSQAERNRIRGAIEDAKSSYALLPSDPKFLGDAMSEDGHVRDHWDRVAAQLPGNVTGLVPAGGALCVDLMAEALVAWS